MAWFARFARPIKLEDSRQLFSLRDAADYIAALPKTKRNAAHWKIATEALILAAERNGAEMLARIAVQMALNGGKPPPVPEPRRKIVRKLRVIH